jgi:hypothetical protein
MEVPTVALKINVDQQLHTGELPLGPTRLARIETLDRYADETVCTADKLAQAAGADTKAIVEALLAVEARLNHLAAILDR